MTSIALVRSRFPVGSSPIIIRGSWMSALAIQVRCISHHESDSTNTSFFARSPTFASTSGTRLVISYELYPHTSMANATFSLTVFLGRSLKSWKIVQRLRRYCRSSFGENVDISLPLSSNIVPDFSFLAQSMDLIKLVFPLHDVPMRKTNSPGSILIDISLRIVLSQ